MFLSELSNYKRIPVEILRAKNFRRLAQLNKQLNTFRHDIGGTIQSLVPPRQTHLELGNNLRAVVLNATKRGQVLVVVERLVRLAVVLDGERVRFRLDKLRELVGQLEQELQLLQQHVDAVQLAEIVAARLQRAVDLVVELGDGLHVAHQVAHLVLHLLEVVLHLADRVRGAYKLVVVLVDERLHLAVEAAHLLHDLILDVHELVQAFFLAKNF